MLHLISDPGYTAPLTFYDAMRVYMTGRQFLDVYTIRQILVLRDERKQSAGEIEKALGLRQGTVGRLGPVGVTGLAQEVERAQGHVDMR